METSPRVAAEIEAQAETLVARRAEWERRALDNVLREPALAATYTARKARVYWRAWFDRSVSPTWLVVASAAVLVPLLLGGFCGLVRLARTQPAEAAFLGLVILVPFLAQLPYQVVIRLRVPFSEVPLCVLAAGFAWSQARRLTRPDIP
jgi:hypothetical protein